MAINVLRISLNHEKLHLVHCSVQGVLYDLINVLGLFLVILQPLSSLKVNLTYISSACKIVRKITKILKSFGFKLNFKSFRSVML